MTSKRPKAASVSLTQRSASAGRAQYDQPLSGRQAGLGRFARRSAGRRRDRQEDEEVAALHDRRRMSTIPQIVSSVFPTAYVTV